MILNEYGNITDPHIRDEIARANQAWINTLWPALQEVSLADARTMLNMAMFYIGSEAAEYMTMRQTREHKAKLVEEYNDTSSA